MSWLIDEANVWLSPGDSSGTLLNLPSWSANVSFWWLPVREVTWGWTWSGFLSLSHVGSSRGWARSKAEC